MITSLSGNLSWHDLSLLAEYKLYVMANADVGLLGLGVMGSSLARNIHSRGYKVSVYNRTQEVTDEYIAKYGDDNLAGYPSLEEFVASLKAPRKVIIMVPDKAVDPVLRQLAEVLDEGDLVMDGANAYFKDTIRRQEMMAENGIGLLGTGVSGGEEGALNGPSLMPSGAHDVYQAFAPILADIAAKDFAGGPCVSYIGDGAAGHYVKMVHNGIEYGDMQLLAEAYTLLRFVGGLEMEELADVFKKYGQGKMASFLVDILVDIFEKKDDQGNDGYLLDYILDKAGQKGTGRWTAMEALELGVPLGTVMAAVNGRNLSAQKELRVRLAGGNNDVFKTVEGMDKERLVLMVENALYGAKISAYAQGYALLQAAEAEYNFGLDLAEISRIWQGGCIIRADLLRMFTEVWQEDAAKHLFEFESVREQMLPTVDDWQALIGLAAQTGVPVPGLSSAIGYVDGMFTSVGSATLIQAMRDHFGAHTFERTDREGKFHAEW